ncbi:MAG: hypothetical protein HZB14_00240 [Actinobacteria bacterium]|nr:hypothetical protein [Actinomycetota bacterium]
MNRVARKFNSLWGAVLVICITIVVASAATATAAKVINGKYIKKNTVASKQIKNGTIVKADLNKNLSVTGPTGAQGPKGDAGATSVVSHRTVEPGIANTTIATTTAECAAGEHLVGGGAGFVVSGTNAYDFTATLHGSIPTGADGKPVLDLAEATGWRASATNTTGSTRDFVVIALCAKP